MTVAELKKEILAIKQKLESGEYRVVSIDGPQGPTGKTTAANLLRAEGIPVHEEWQLFNIWIGWNSKPKTSIMMWHEFVKNAGKICKMIRKGYHGYQAVIVGGTHRVDDVINFFRCEKIDVYRESEVLRFTLSTYADRTMEGNLPLY